MEIVAKISVANVYKELGGFMALSGIKNKLRNTFVYTLYKRLGLDKFLSPSGWQTTKRWVKDSVTVPLFHRSLWPLHKRLRRHLKDQSEEWPHISYAYGYFYQRWDRIKVSGARSTEKRFRDYQLDELLKPDMTVLDVGCNAGFLAMAVAEKVKHVDAVEYNPFQVRIGEEVRDFLKIDNVDFYQMDFLEFVPTKKYDLIMSFANHKTLDGNMAPQLRKYFLNLYDMLVDDGILLFESHQFDNHDPEFHECIAGLTTHYSTRRKLEIPETKDDVDRIFYVFDKHPVA